VVLLGSGMPNGPVLYFQGDAQTSVVFGDGLRCVAGNEIRLGTELNAASASQYPGVGDLPISVRGAVPAGGAVRTYQAWYRSATPGFCTSATFNLTNGYTIVWSQ
jgi:hypothetical protein